MSLRFASVPWVLGCLLAAPGAALAQAEREIYVYGAPSRDSTYRNHDQTTGTREQRDVRDVPQALSVVSRALLDDTAARRADDALPFVPSVQLGAGFGAVWDDYTVRGFRVWAGSMHRNGYLAGYSGIGAVDAVNVERIEVLRGPTAALYGPGLPGGTINVITKQPSFVADRELAVGFGSFDSRRFTLDATGPLDPRVAYRVTGSFDDTDGPRDFNDSRRVVVNPSVVFELGKTRVLLETQLFQMSYRPDAMGVPAVDGDYFHLPRERSYIEPETPLAGFRGGLLHAELRRQLSPAMALRFGVQRQSGYLDEPATYALGVRDDGRTLDRLATHFWSHSEDVAAQIGLEIQGSTWGLRHDLALGADARYESVDWRVAAADPAADFSIDLFEPDYSGSLPRVLDAPGPDNRWSYALAGLYASDRIALSSQLAVALGLRGDLYRQRSEAQGVDQKLGELAPSARAGVILTPAEALSFYTSVNRGFWPVVGVSADGQLLEPERNWGLELGARLALPRDLLALDVSLFRTENRNISVPDPERPDFQVQRGAARSQGLELEATLRLARSLRGLASYTLSDARITDDLDPALVGRELPGVPRHAGALWLQWFPFGAKIGTGVGGGALLVGERALNDGASLPRYARFDAVLSQRLGRAVVLRARIENLGDARYVRGGNGEDSVYFGAPRSGFASLAASF